MNMINKAKKDFNKTINLHFTCLEMNDYRDGENAHSMAKSLVKYFGDLAKDKGITLKGENALAGGLYNDNGWQNMAYAINNHYYSGVTLLRMHDVVENYSKLINFMNEIGADNLSNTMEFKDNDQIDYQKAI
jgi:beta-amylase